MRLYSPNANTIYIGVNNTTPAHTLDIVNVASGVNALNIKNAAATSTVLSVTDAGNTSIAGTLSAANTSLSGTLSVTGNTTLNGSLTQSVGGSTKFSVDTSGNATIATSLCVATGSPYLTAVTTIYTPSANTSCLTLTSAAPRFAIIPQCTNGAFNTFVQGNDVVMQYSNGNGFCITGTTSGTGLRLDSGGNTNVNGTLSVTSNTTISGGLTLNTSTGSAITLPSTYVSTPGSACLGYTNMATTTSGALVTGTWLNLNSTALNLTAGTWLVTASCVFTGTSTACTSVQGAISTSNTAPDSYAARTNMPSVGITFTGMNAGVASFCLSRVFALPTTQSVYLLMSAYFTNGAMTASGSSGMAATRLG